MDPTARLHEAPWRQGIHSHSPSSALLTCTRPTLIIAWGARAMLLLRGSSACAGPTAPCSRQSPGPPLQASDTTIASTLCMHGCVELTGARASPPRHLSYRVALVPCARHVGLGCESNAVDVLVLDCPGAPASMRMLAGWGMSPVSSYVPTPYAPYIHTHAWPWAKLGPGHRTHAPRPPCSRVTRHRLGWLRHETGAVVGGYALAPQD
jgi:hypothetical protein